MDILIVLWQRQMKRYVRSGSRLLGSLGQPILLLLALGYGIGAIYRRAGDGDYLHFLVPGIITQTVLLSAIFWGIIILQDKRFGFLAELLVAPVSRLRILLGSAIGGATISIIQGTMVFFISMFLGFRPHEWSLVPVAFLVLVFMSIALTCFGAAALLPWWTTFQGFQGINNLLVMPLFFLSGALYPLNNVPTFLRIISTINPVTYMVDALRYLIGGASQSHFGITKDLIIMTITFIVALTFAVNRFNRIQV